MFCEKCGTKIDGVSFCPKCGADVRGYNAAPIPRSNGGIKLAVPMVIIILLIVAALVVMLGVSAQGSRTVDKPCDWCGKSPSVAYKTSHGNVSYVCAKCSKNCFWCGDKATTHYENLLGMVVFVCDDCHKKITGK